MIIVGSLLRVLSFFFLGLTFATFALFVITRDRPVASSFPNTLASSPAIVPATVSTQSAKMPDVTIETLRPAQITISPVTCGIFAAVACARWFDVPVDLSAIWQKAKWTKQGLSMFELKSLCEQELGLKAEGVRYHPDGALPSTIPAILWVRGGDVPSFSQPHYIVYLGRAKDDSNKLVYFDPSTGINLISLSDLFTIWTGECLLLARPGN